MASLFLHPSFKALWIFPYAYMAISPPLFEHMIIPSLYIEPDIFNTSVGSQMGQLGMSRLFITKDTRSIRVCSLSLFLDSELEY